MKNILNLYNHKIYKFRVIINCEVINVCSPANQMQMSITPKTKIKEICDLCLHIQHEEKEVHLQFFKTTD
jgi:hypothetical protein